LHSRHFLIKVETEYTKIFQVNEGITQGSILLYLLYIADLPASPESNTQTFAEDNAVLTTDSEPATASQKLETNLLAIQN
jgi:hypothetical protein